MITEYQSNAISYLRALSLIMIVSCHICQVYGNHWAWVLNFGVQIFFVISGYLYGSRYVSNWKSWAVGRIRKVYLPFLVYLVIVLPFYFIYHRESISIFSPIIYFFDIQGMYWGGVILGLNHLWFLTDIGICYAITPFLQYVSEFKPFVKWRWILLFLITCALIVVILRFNGWHYHVLLYSIAYMVGKFLWKWEWIALFALLAFSASMLVGDVSWELILNGGAKAYLWRVISCLLIFMTFLWVFNRINFTWRPFVIRLLDRHSYYAYIVHHIYIIGPFSVIVALDYTFKSILYVIGLIVLSSACLSIISGYVDNKLTLLWIKLK